MNLRFLLFLLFPMLSLAQMTTISVVVPDASDEVYIVGNQKNLGDWQPGKVKLERTSDFKRTIQTALTFPAEFKLTRGSWQTEAVVSDYETEGNLTLQKPGNYNFEVAGWKDRKMENGKVTLGYSVDYIRSKKYPDEERGLRIFLPNNYNATKKYPVIFTLDGQNLFNVVMQQVAILEDKTYGENDIIPQCIVVGIDNTNRFRDLMPNDGRELKIPFGEFLPETGIFYEILKEEILPFIHEKYAVSGYDVLIGHSDSGHFATNVFMKDDNPFGGIVALSVNDFGRYFRENLAEKLHRNEGKTLFLGYGNKDDEFNFLGKYLQEKNTKSRNFMLREYNADHMQMPFTALSDALKFMFADYKNYDDLIEKEYNESFDYSRFEKLYAGNLKKRYGIEKSIGEDIYYLLNKARDKKNVSVFHKLLDAIDAANTYQLQIRFYASNEFNQDDRAKNYLYQMLESDDNTDKLIFYANLKTQYKTFFLDKLKQPEEFIRFIEKAKKKWPEYTLEFNYLIVKTASQTNIVSRKFKSYLSYCLQHYRENRYFKKADLDLIHLK